MSKKIFTTILLIGSFFTALPVAAVDRVSIKPIGTFLPVAVATDAAEADKIHLFTDKDGRIERIYVQGCTKCPLRLTTDDKTRFTYNGKIIKQNKIKSHSLKPGTVIYDVESKHATKVNW
jgi:hypothetical protein